MEKDQKKLKTTPLGQAVNTVMMEQFPNIVDVKFSADMEKKLDVVEAGKADWVETIDDFYKGFAKSLEQAEKNKMCIRDSTTSLQLIIITYYAAVG